ncbi:MAG: hypothetical protein E7291_08170 [Lachnospiraceae bacterium]|nr:hypothetical protein [Lachnospiraceae bacterium]
MTKDERMEKSIKNNLSILRAWSEGRIKITTGCDDMANNTYNLNTLMNIIENNALEGITPPTEIIQKGDRNYEILITIPTV